MSRTYHIFISHSWQHTKDLENLRFLLNEKGYFNVEFEEISNDEPIGSENANHIKSRLKMKLENSDIVLGLACIYACYSVWMEWALDKALDLEIPIIGIIPHGQDRISTTVSSRSITDVRWNTESIVRAIRACAK